MIDLLHGTTNLGLDPCGTKKRGEGLKMQMTVALLKLCWRSMKISVCSSVL